MRYLDQYSIVAGTVSALIGPETLDGRRKAARKEAAHHNAASLAHQKMSNEWQRIADELDDEYHAAVQRGELV